MPGVLPVLNRKVVEFTIRMALATECSINAYENFARKNYFYPDLPKGYQISQYAHPLAEHGHIEILLDGEKKRIGITRIHMEEDAGKLIHDERNPWSYVDFNRTGVPLIEIVSEPDMRSPEEAGEYLRRLRDILVYLEICDGNMEEGIFRCDANVSIRPRGRDGLRHPDGAQEHELLPQRPAGPRVRDQAPAVHPGERRRGRPGDPPLGRRPGADPLHAQQGGGPRLPLLPRSGPRSHPDLRASGSRSVRRALPELPLAKQDRFVAQYGIPVYDASVLTTTRALADFYEETVKLCGKPKIVSNWVMGDLLRYLNEQKRDIKDSPVSPDHVAQMINLIEDGTISGKIAKEVFEEMYKSSKKPADIVKEKGLTQITDEGAVVKAIEEAMAKNPAQLAEYRAGKEKLFAFFVGQVMKLTKGKANPQLVNDLLKKMLSGS